MVAPGWWIRFLAGPAAFAALYLGNLSGLSGLSYEGRVALATFVWAIVWWMLQPIPLGVTALLPLVVFPVLGAANAGTTASLYGQNIFFWILGTTMLGYAMQKHGLAKRFSLWFLGLPGVAASTPRLVFVYMLTTALVSMFVSDTATVALMIPIGMSIYAYVQGIQHSEGDVALSSRGSLASSIDCFKFRNRLGIEVAVETRRRARRLARFPSRHGGASPCRDGGIDVDGCQDLHGWSRHLSIFRYLAQTDRRGSSTIGSEKGDAMSSPVTTELSDVQFEALQRGCAGLLVTVGEDRFPTTAFVWTVAVSSKTLRFGVEGSATLSNLERERRASLQIIGSQNQVFLVKGKTALAKPRLEALPFESAMMSLEVTEIKDQTWPEVHVRELSYEWISDRREEWQAIEQAVYKEMREQP